VKSVSGLDSYPFLPEGHIEALVTKDAVRDFSLVVAEDVVHASSLATDRED